MIRLALLVSVLAGLTSSCASAPEDHPVVGGGRGLSIQWDYSFLRVTPTHYTLVDLVADHVAFDPLINASIAGQGVTLGPGDVDQKTWSPGRQSRSDTGLADAEGRWFPLQVLEEASAFVPLTGLSNGNVAVEVWCRPVADGRGAGPLPVDLGAAAWRAERGDLLSRYVFRTPERTPVANGFRMRRSELEGLAMAAWASTDQGPVLTAPITREDMDGWLSAFELPAVGKVVVRFKVEGCFAFQGEQSSFEHAMFGTALMPHVGNINDAVICVRVSRTNSGVLPGRGKPSSRVVEVVDCHVIEVYSRGGWLPLWGSWGEMVDEGRAIVVINRPHVTIGGGMEHSVPRGFLKPGAEYWIAVRPWWKEGKLTLKAAEAAKLARGGADR